MNNNPEAIAIGCKLLNEDYSWQYFSGGQFLTLKRLINYFLFLDRLFSNSNFFSGLYLQKIPHSIKQVDWISGACMMVRREPLDKIGLLNENYFMYFEDMEWCFRFKEQKWKIYFLPYESIMHYHAKSMEHQTNKIYKESIKNFYKVYKLINKTNDLFILKLVMVCGYFFRTVFYLCVAIIQRNQTDKKKLILNYNFLKASVLMALSQ